jgi:hypothetical protein
MESIFEFLLMLLFVVPGAFFRWLLSGCKGSLKDFIKNGDAYLDGIIGITIVVIIVLLIKKIF